MIRKLFCLILLSCGLWCPGAHAEQLPVRIYTAADGLGSSAVNSILADSRGFLWFCTRDGLSRFDGQQFTNYGVADGLATPTVSSISEARNGVYWVMTRDGLVYRFAPEAPRAGALFKPYQVTDKGQSYPANSLFTDHAGNLWLGAHNGLFRYHEDTDEFGPVTPQFGLWPVNFFDIVQINEGPDGSLWLGTNNGIIRLWPKGQVTYYHIKPSSPDLDTAKGLLLDKAGRLWIGHNEGLMILKPESTPPANSFTTRRLPATPPVAGTSPLPTTEGATVWFTKANGLPADDVQELIQTSDGRCWVLSTTGLAEFTGAGFHAYTTANGLGDTLLSGLAEDRDGNLWVGSFNGAIKVARNSFTGYSTADGLAHNSIVNLLEDDDGNFLVVTPSWAVNRFDGQRFSAITPPLKGYPGALWLSNWALRDHTGAWWLLTPSALLYYPNLAAMNRAPARIYTKKDGLPGSSLFRAYEDAQGDLWFSTRELIKQSPGSGLARWSRHDGTFHVFTEAEGFPVRRAVSAFAEDRSGQLWLGFYDVGGEGALLARYKDGRFSTVEIGLTGGAVSALFTDSHGRLWVASVQHGLKVIEDPAAEQPVIHTYTTADGLSSNNVRCLTEDTDGNIYAGTVRGVDAVNPDTRRVRHFTLNDGLPNDFVHIAYRDRQGVLWFGTLRGLARFAPPPARAAPLPLVALNSVQVNGVKQPVAELGQTEITLPDLHYSQNQLELGFFSISFALGTAPRYRYLLEGGAGQGWSVPTEQRTVTLANLAPGSYTFQVIAINADGATSVQPARITFRILPPVWQSWWFRGLLLLAAGGLIFTFVRLRLTRERAVHAAREERLRELERVRRRIATDLHDDIGSSLTQISILSEVLRRQLNTGNLPATRTLRQIAASSRDLVDDMSDIVWAINPQKDHLEDLLQRMRAFATAVLEARNVELEWDAPDDTDMPLGANLRREVLLIFKETVNNIVKHSGSTRVVVNLSLTQESLCLRVQDNGCGFELARQSEGHGLASMRERAAGLGGSLQLASAVGAGTALNLQIPLNA